jgi:hypothetical protein
MRVAVILLVAMSVNEMARAQLLRQDLDPPSVFSKVERASAVPKKLGDNASLGFVALDMLFDGGSHCAEFRRNDGGRLTLFFGHPGYWSNGAKRDSKQPVAILIHRQPRPLLVEVERSSALEKRLIELLTKDLSNGKHAEPERSVLTRIRDCLRDRKPLKEIEERFDVRTGEVKTPDPFPDSSKIFE